MTPPKKFPKKVTPAKKMTSTKNVTQPKSVIPPKKMIPPIYTGNIQEESCKDYSTFKKDTRKLS